jgi:hypothetical protein
MRWVVSFVLQVPQHPPTTHHPPPEEKTPGTHCTGDWVGLRTGLNVAEKKVIYVPVGSRILVLEFIVSHYTNCDSQAPLV